MLQLLYEFYWRIFNMCNLTWVGSVSMRLYQMLRTWTMRFRGEYCDHWAANILLPCWKNCTTFCGFPAASIRPSGNNLAQESKFRNFLRRPDRVDRSPPSRMSQSNPDSAKIGWRLGPRVKRKKTIMRQACTKQRYIEGFLFLGPQIAIKWRHVCTKIFNHRKQIY